MDFTLNEIQQELKHVGAFEFDGNGEQPVAS